jgi:hypothetical protein
MGLLSRMLKEPPRPSALAALAVLATAALVLLDQLTPS